MCFHPGIKYYKWIASFFPIELVNNCSQEMSRAEENRSNTSQHGSPKFGLGTKLPDSITYLNSCLTCLFLKGSRWTISDDFVRLFRRKTRRDFCVLTRAVENYQGDFFFGTGTMYVGKNNFLLNNVWVECHLEADLRTWIIVVFFNKPYYVHVRIQIDTYILYMYCCGL